MDLAVPARTLRGIRPVFVVCAPGTGGTDLVREVAAAAGLALLSPSDDLFAPTPELQPSQRGWDSSRLGLQDAKPRRVAALSAAWAEWAGPDDGEPDDDGPDDDRPVAFVVSYADIALHVEFLAAAWPQARFVHLESDAAQARDAMVAGWQAGTHVSAADLPDWSGPAWSYALVPGWRALRGRSVADIVAAQWETAHQVLERDLAEVPAARVHHVSSRDRADDPAGVVRRVSEWLRSGPNADTDAADQPSELRSSSTASFSELLRGLGATAVITTYQSGYLVLARAQDKGVNTHFRRLPRPMGTAFHDGLLSVGTKSDVITYANVPQAAATLPPAGTYDAAFLPRHSLHTGDIRVHDLAWVQGQLWAVATRFSCLVTFDGRHNFVPRWRPPFISALAPEDRCHLNGMAVVGDRVKYVTALGTGDTAGSWRETKVRGGIIMDVESNEVVVGGLSMPHSPTWYRDQLWFLESGEGALSRVDVATGQVERVAELPGFTRGLAFAGRYAFVGLSEVREANLFGGLPLTARLEDRECGVWVVDLETREVVAWLRFEAAVQEIYDVALLPGMRWPEIFDVASEEAANTFMLP